MRFDLLRTDSEQIRKLPAGALQPGSMRETYFKEGTQMISTLKKKLNKKGFTLAELLIVIAIIAILVAIAIPVFTAQLQKAQDSVKAANIRSVRASASVEILTDWDTYGTAGSNTATAWKVDATITSTGDIKSLTITPQASGTATDGTYTAPSSSTDGSIAGMIITEVNATTGT